MRVLLLCAVLVGAVTLCGCGGGSGASGSSGKVIRQLQVGDRLNYSIVNGTFETGTETLDASVRMECSTHAGVDDPRHGGRSLEMVMISEIRLEDGFTIMDIRRMYLEQTADGTIYELGSEDIDTSAFLLSSTGDPVLYRSPMAPNDSYSYTASYSDNTSAAHRLDILGEEYENPSTGTVRYEYRRTVTTGSGGSVTEGYFLPSTGYPSIMDIEWQLPQGTLRGKFLGGTLESYSGTAL